RGGAERVHGAEGLESGLLGAAMAIVLGHGASEGITCPREHRRCARQPISAPRSIRGALLRMRCALELDEAVELRLEVGPQAALPKSVDRDTERHCSSSRSTSRFFSSTRATVSLPSARRVGGLRAAVSWTITCASRCGSPGC